MAANAGIRNVRFDRQCKNRVGRSNRRAVANQSQRGSEAALLSLAGDWHV